MLHKKIDIIIPVYNKSCFMYELVFSLSKLPANLFNIIFVDDGSTDDSYQIVDGLISNNHFENFFLFQKLNGGVSSARNLGLNISQSEYVWFFDPDDFIDERFFTEMDSIKNLQGDIIVFNYSIKDLRKKIEEDIFFENYGMIDSHLFVSQNDALISKRKNMNVIWNKFYKREFISNLRFDESIHLGEDRLFNLQFFSKKPKALLINIFIYNYMLYSKDTLSTSLNDEKVNDIYKINNYQLAMGFNTRSHVKHHILDQIKSRTIIGQSGLYNFYINEHRKNNIKVFKLTGVGEFILLFLIFFRVNIVFYRLYKYLFNFK